MKKHISILVLILSFVVFQGCGSKTESDQEAASTLSEKSAKVEEVASKRAKHAKDCADKTALRSEALAAKAKLSTTYTDASGKLVYYRAEVDPSYTGGQRNLDQYLKDHLKYPKEAEENGIEGTVFVDFVITESGQVREVMASDVIGEDVDFSLKEEAVRVVAAMPGWKTGTQHGKPVDVSFSIPITFELVN